MKNTMKYKGYTGGVAFDAEDRIFHGRVLGVSSALIGFEGATVADLEKDFQNAIDDYLEMCEEQGTAPEKPFKGSFNIRLFKTGSIIIFAAALSKDAILATKDEKIRNYPHVETV